MRFDDGYSATCAAQFKLLDPALTQLNEDVMSNLMGSKGLKHFISRFNVLDDLFDK